jgi:hypothetical protein
MFRRVSAGDLSYIAGIEHIPRKMLISSQMQTEQIAALLIAERDRLSRAIEALQGSARQAGRPRPKARKSAAPVAVAAKLAPKKRRISAAGRKAIADAAKRRWAAVRAAKASSTNTAAKAAGSATAPKKGRAAGRKAAAKPAKSESAAKKS